MANEFKIKKGLIVTGASGGTVVDIQGSQGQLFSVTDNLSGEIFAVADISGVPIFNVNSSGVSYFDGSVGIGTDSPAKKLQVSSDITYDGIQISGSSIPTLAIIDTTNNAKLVAYARDSDATIGTETNHPLTINTNNTTALTLDTSQNAAFAGSVTIPNYIYHAGDPNTFFGFDGNDQIAIKTSGNYNFFADSAATTLYAAGNAKLKTTIVSVGTATTAGGTLIDGWKTTTQANAINDTTIATTAYVNNKIGLIPAGLVFQGTWNAATNTPTLTSGSGTTGNFYIVSVAGSTNLDGITDWKVGDWAVFIEQGASDQWEKIDNSSVLDGFGTGQSVTKWDGSGTSNTLTDGPITFNTNDSTFAGDISIPVAKKLYFGGGSHTYIGEDIDDRLRFFTGGAEFMRFSLGNNKIDFYKNATFGGSINVNSGPSRFTDQQNAGSRIELYNNRQDASNVEVYRIAAYNSVEVTGVHFYRGGGGQSGYTKIFAKKNNASNLEEVVQFGTNDALTTTFSGDVTIDSSTATLNIKGSNTGASLINFADAADGNVGRIYYDHQDNFMQFKTNDAEKLRIDSNGVLQLTSDINGYLNANAVGMEIDINRNPETGTFKDTGLSHARIIMRGDTTANGGSNIKFVTSPTVNTVGTTKMTIAGDGNVGIGTTSPTGYRLVVENTSEDLLKLHNSTDGFDALISFTNPGGTLGRIQGIDNGGLGFDVGNNAGGINSNAMFIKNNGNVGIGTTSADYLLDLYKSTGTSATTTGTTLQRLWNYVGQDINQQKTFIDFVFQDNNNNEYPQVRVGAEVGQNGNADTQIKEGSGAFVVYTNNATGDGPGSPTGLAERFRVDYAGNVGIGTTSPDAKLEVSTSATGNVIGTLLTNTNGAGTADSVSLNFGLGRTADGFIRSVSAVKLLKEQQWTGTPSTVDASLVFSTVQNETVSEKMRITSAGNVGIGTTGPLSRLSIGSNAITTKKPTVIIADGVAGGSLVIRGLSPILSFDRTGANPENKILMDGVGLEFKTGSLDAEGDVDFKIKLDGKLQAPAYTQGFLQSDANGNIEISGGGTLPGGPYLPLSAGSNFPLTSTLYIKPTGNPTNTMLISARADDAYGNIQFTNAAETANWTQLRSTSTQFTINNVNVGIGTTSPDDKLDVVDGNAQMVFGTASSDRAYMQFKHNAVPVDGEELCLMDFSGYNSASQNTRYVILTAKAEDVTDGSEDGSLSFLTMKDGTATQVMTLRSGNVGIGTSTPSAKLDIQGTQGQLFSVTDDLSGEIFAVADISGVPIMTVNSSGVSYFDGSVGIGATSPQSKLHIETGSGGTYNPNTNHDDVTIEGSGNIGLQLFSPNTSYQYIAFGDPNSVNAGYLRYYHGANEMVFRTSGSDNMIIDGNGDVGIGTTSPQSGGGAASWLSLNGTAAYSGGVAYTIGSVTKAYSYFESDYLKQQAQGGSGQKFIVNGTNTAMTILSSGNVGIGTTGPNTKLQVSGTGLQGMQAWFGNGFVNNASYHYSFAKVGFSSEDNDGADTGAGFQFNTRNAADTNWIHGYIYQPQDGGIAFGTGGAGTTQATERMRITSAGNIGIGTNSPSVQLEVANKSLTRHTSSSWGQSAVANPSDAEVAFVWAAGGTGYPGVTSTYTRQWIAGLSPFSTGTDRWSLTNKTLGANTAITVLEDGKIGMRTISPRVHAEISGSGQTTANISDTGNPGAFLQVSDTGNAAGAGGGILFAATNDNSTTTPQAGIKSLLTNGSGQGAGNLAFSTRGGTADTALTERMRILANGNVGINVTNPGNKLSVGGSVRINNSGNGQLFFGTGSLNKIELDGTDMELWSGGLVPTITMSNQGLIKFGIYGLSGTGTPNNLLGVDSSGNVVKTNSFNLRLDDTPAANTTSGSGNIVNWSVSESVTAGTLYAVKTNGGWTTADADSEPKSTYMLAIALGSNATAGMLLQGFFYKSSHGFTIGAPLYVSNTAGAFSNSRPTGSGDYVRIIGYATSTNYIYFDPDKTWVKIA